MALYSAQRTIFAISLQLAMLSGKEYRIKNNSTVNKWIEREKKAEAVKDNTEAASGPIEEEVFGPGNYPRLRYVVFGEGGLGSVNGENGNFPFTQHCATDGIPFKPVRIDDLKKNPNLSINDQSYILPLRDDQVLYDGTFYAVSKSKDVHTVEIFEQEDPFLNPKPLDKNNMIIGDSSSYILSQLKVKLQLEAEILENLRYNSESGIITEIALCTGLDNYKHVQVAYHIDMTLDLEAALATDGRIDRVIEVGGQCPLLK